MCVSNCHCRQVPNSHQWLAMYQKICHLTSNMILCAYYIFQIWFQIISNVKYDFMWLTISFRFSKQLLKWARLFFSSSLWVDLEKHIWQPCQESMQQNLLFKLIFNISAPPHSHTLYPQQHHFWGNIFQSCVWNFASDGGHLAAAWVRGHSGLVYPGQALKLGREILPCSRQQGSRQPQGSSPQSGLTFMNEPIREGFLKSTKLNVL